jgi:hypothetical protein
LDAGISLSAPSPEFSAPWDEFKKLFQNIIGRSSQSKRNGGGAGEQRARGRGNEIRGRSKGGGKRHARLNSHFRHLIIGLERIILTLFLKVMDGHLAGGGPVNRSKK